MIQPAPQYLQTAKVCDANKAADAPPRYRGLSCFGHWTCAQFHHEPQLLKHIVNVIWKQQSGMSRNLAKVAN